MRAFGRVTALLVALAALLLLPVGPTAPAPASAHPLGNFTVNHYDGLTVHPDRIEVLAVLDSAEIPTVQQRVAVDTDGDRRYSPAEAAAHGVAECAAMAAAMGVTVDGTPAPFAVVGAEASFPVREQGLPTTRVSCRLVAPADLSGGALVAFTDAFRTDRIGWREITATGDGLRVVAADVPAGSVSDGLRVYPEDLLADPLDQRSARISVAPGGADAAGAGPAGAGPVLPPVTGIGRVDRILESGGRYLDSLATSSDLTVPVATLAVLMALVLGAAHAMLPGHGKTVMAAYLAGRRGTRRDALVVGATVTVTHTAGVLVFALLITLLTAFAPAAAMRWLGAVSGLLVAAVGLTLLRSAVRRRRELAALAAGERTGVLVEAAVGAVPGAHPHGHGHGHGDGHGDGHGHGGGPSTDGGWSRTSLVGMGVAGGLVPSPTALLVLLAAVEFGRTWLGLGLVVCYALGMAGTLTAAGLLLVSVHDRLAVSALSHAWRARGARLASALPLGTALLVLVVGVGLAVRALGG